MNLSDIALLRLKSQQICCSQFSSPSELVSYMGALQAQDFAWSKWAVGLRLTDSSESQIENAISESEILRTHVLRPTWHIVSGQDINWMLDLTAPQIKNTANAHHRALGLTPEILEKSAHIIKQALLGHKSLSRDELNSHLEAAGIITTDQRSAHILFSMELEQLLCSGTVKKKQHSYALLAERVEQKERLSSDDAVKKLAAKYFHSHGPATVEDFSWWSGLNLTKARRGLELASADLQSFTLSNSVYWFSKAITDVEKVSGAFLLPAYDEFIISYKDRSAALPSAHLQKVLNKNGIFWPVVVIDGQVHGTWARTIKKDRVNINVTGFRSFNLKQKKLIEKAASQFGGFIGMEAELLFV